MVRKEEKSENEGKKSDEKSQVKKEDEKKEEEEKEEEEREEEEEKDYSDEENKRKDVELENKKRFIKQIITLDSMVTFLSGVFLTDLIVRGALTLISFGILCISWVFFVVSIYYGYKAFDEAMQVMGNPFREGIQLVYKLYKTSIKLFFIGIITFILFNVSVFIFALF